MRSYPFLLRLHPRQVFRTARASRPWVENVFLALEQDGVLAFGEASPNRYYGEDAGEIRDLLLGLADYFKRLRLESPADIGAVWEDIWPRVRPSRAAQCAVVLALWDLAGKLRGESAARLAHGQAAAEVVSAATVGLADDPAELAAKLDEVAPFPLVKVKAGPDGALATVAALRSRSHSRFCVDANASWGASDAAGLARDLAAAGCEFLEQPFPPSEDGRMPALLAASPIPIFADESCVRPGDVDALAGRFSGCNVKLVKCGGLTPALAMLRRARELGLRTMVGCMLESQLLIAAGAVAAQGCDYADLDGSWLLRDQPFTGLDFDRGRIRMPDHPGLGVVPRPAGAGEPAQG